jgi:hypothetical protein
VSMINADRQYYKKQNRALKRQMLLILLLSVLVLSAVMWVGLSFPSR